eukprot:snap_masked-scaffold_6-processed-gene-5.29-mRNA-1 protein AED:1.00 eAED:1.00 QI:0/-1/0/0/-1/1/1/0/75
MTYKKKIELTKFVKLIVDCGSTRFLKKKFSRTSNDVRLSSINFYCTILNVPTEEQFQQSYGSYFDADNQIRNLKF